MSRTLSQAERVAAERSLQQYIEPNLAERQFRLQAADFADMPAGGHTLVVRAVGTQGVERLAPVLHFEGLAKPLVLDPVDVTAMARLTGSPLWSDWMGKAIPLHIAYEDGQRHVRIGHPTPAQRAAVLADPERLAKARRAIWRRVRVALMIALLVVLAIVAVYLVENGPTLIATLRQYLTEQGLIR